jgi:hypothetical protein
MGVARIFGCLLFLLGCSILSGPVALLYAAPCDQELTPIAGHVGYTSRENRCEGFYVSPVSAPSLEILSVLRGPLQYTLSAQEQLVIVAPNLGSIVAGPLRVRAVARPLRTYYRMDAILPASGRLVWPVQDVLLPSRLHAERLGVYGWVGTETDKTFVPLRVVPQGTPVAKAPIQVIVRSTVDIDKLVWRLTAKDEPVSPWEQGSANVPAGQPVTITLPEGPPMVLRLDIAAKAENRDSWAKLTLQLIRDQP